MDSSHCGPPDADPVDPEALEALEDAADAEAIRARRDEATVPFRAQDYA